MPRKTPLEHKRCEGIQRKSRCKNRILATNKRGLCSPCASSSTYSTDISEEMLAKKRKWNSIKGPLSIKAPQGYM